MHKYFSLISFVFFLIPVSAQTVIGDCTLVFAISGTNGGANKSLESATKTFYVKGKMSRTDLKSENFSQSIIYNTLTGSATILKEVGSEKYRTDLNPAQWKRENKMYEGMSFKETSEKKVILGYTCIKAIVTLKDGSSFSYYFTRSITPTASENPYQFKDAGGFVLEYEARGPSGGKIIYTATKINFNPVPAALFDIPKAGYRVLPYNGK